jgi:hypothetical protein
MKKELVGIRRGKRAINWPALLLLGLLVGLVSGCSAAATWFLLTKEFSLIAALLPVLFCVGLFLGIGSRKAFPVPPQQFPILD